MNFSGYNPKKNASLDSLRKSEVTLLAIFAEMFAEKSRIWELDRELSSKYPRNSRMGDNEAIRREIQELVFEAYERAFGTRQQPIVLSFGPDVYTAFIPDIMNAEELRAFRTSLKIHGIAPAKVTARKLEGGWTYALN